MDRSSLHPDCFFWADCHETLLERLSSPVAGGQSSSRAEWLSNLHSASPPFTGSARQAESGSGVAYLHTDGWQARRHLHGAADTARCSPATDPNAQRSHHRSGSRVGGPSLEGSSCPDLCHGGAAGVQREILLFGYGRPCFGLEPPNGDTGVGNVGARRAHCSTRCRRLTPLFDDGWWTSHSVHVTQARRSAPPGCSGAHGTEETD